MTDVQIFQIFGLVFFGTGLGMLVDQKFIKKMMEGLHDNAVALYLTGVLTLTVGYLLVAFHNVWSSIPAIIVAVFGWLALFKGLALLAFPSTAVRMANDLVKSKTCLSIATALILIFGICFLYLGFIAV